MRWRTRYENFLNHLIFEARRSLDKVTTRNHVTTHYSIVSRETDERWKGIIR